MSDTGGGLRHEWGGGEMLRLSAGAGEGTLGVRNGATQRREGLVARYGVDRIYLPSTSTVLK